MAAENPGDVADNRDPVKALSETVTSDRSGIASTNVEMVEVHEIIKKFDSSVNEKRPLVIANSLASPVPELSIERSTSKQWHRSHFHVRGRHSIAIERESESGAEGDDYLDAPSSNNGKTLHLGIIHHSNRSAN